ncbi:MAG: DUF6576 domain-containing protein [Ilumatobacter sp.]
MSQYFAGLFRRRPNDGWFKAGGYDLTTVDIMTALGILSMFVWAISPNGLWARLPFASFLVRDFEIWRLVTWPIAEQPGFFAVIGLAFFWSFGQQIEGLFGRTKFLWWIAAVTLVPALLTTLLGLLSSSFEAVEFGLGPIFLAGIWVYAGTYPNVRWFEVVPLWAIAAVFTVLQVLQLTGGREAGGLTFLFATIAAALSAGRSLGLANAWPIPHIPLSSGGASRPKRAKPSKPKRPRRGDAGQRVVEGPWRKDTTPPPPTAARPAEASPADQAELDGLLDKIGSDGMNALSSSEKQRLNELSKRLRNR